MQPWKLKNFGCGTCCIGPFRWRTGRVLKPGSPQLMARKVENEPHLFNYPPLGGERRKLRTTGLNFVWNWIPSTIEFLQGPALYFPLLRALAFRTTNTSGGSHPILLPPWQEHTWVHVWHGHRRYSLFPAKEIRWILTRTPFGMFSTIYKVAYRHKDLRTLCERFIFQQVSLTTS